MRPFQANRFGREAAASGQSGSGRSGFTLAEAAVTIAIVALVLLMVVQGLEGAKAAAHYTKSKKRSYELAVVLLGEVQTGIYREELETGMSGTFADRDFEEYAWEVVLGDDVFDEDDDTERPFDNFADRREREREREDAEDTVLSDDEEDEEAEEPFEKIKIRVTFPVMDKDRDNETVLESWVPWVQIYGPSEEDEAEAAAADAAADGGAAGAGTGGAGAGDQAVGAGRGSAPK